MGYSDAFVVAFFNGKRISIGEAAKIAGGGQGNVVVNNTPVNTTPNPPVNNNPVNPVNPEVRNPDQPPVTTVINDVKSTDVKSVDKLFFTVQVGVYSRKVTSAQLGGVSPLNNEILPNGLIRYTSGQYNKFADAVARKNAIVQGGISDAFVTAYYKGQRISPDEAADIIAREGNQILIGGAGTNNTGGNNNAPNNTPPPNNNNNNNPVVVNPPVVNNNPPANNPPPVNTNNPKIEFDPPPREPRDNQPPDENKPIRVVENGGNNVPFEPVPNNAQQGEIVFTVFLGSYTNEVPVSDANKLFRIAGQGVKVRKGNAGSSVFTVGSFRDYATAEQALQRIKEQGFVDAEISAYDGDRRIPEEEMKK